MASKRRQRRKSCTGKRRHATERMAYGEQAGVLRIRGLMLGVYRCGFCSFWHVGHKPGCKRLTHV